MTEFDKSVRSHLGLEIPDEPIKDFDTHEIINTFYLASRTRSYSSGMAVIPMPLGVRDISDVLMAHPVFVDREVLDSCIFALDGIYLSEFSEKQEKSKAE